MSGEILKIIDNYLYCPTCNEIMRAKLYKDIIKECSQEISEQILEMTTLVGYYSPVGHSHDDNCLKRYYVCKNGHEISIAKIRKCPTCDWIGKKECFCHYGKKVEEWPHE